MSKDVQNMKIPNMNMEKFAKSIKFFMAFLCVCVLEISAQEGFNIPMVKATKGEISHVKRYYAKLEAPESANSSVSMRTDGFIQELFVSQTYQKVERGEPLFTFYSPELIDAQSEFLTTKNHLSRQKLELLGVDSKEISTIAKTHKILNQVRFYAPVSGVVFAKNINVGSGVKKGEEILRIINLDTLWVVANINQEDIAFIQHTNNKAYVHIEGYKEKIPIDFEMLYPQVLDGYLKARFSLPNANLEFFPDMFAYVFIESPSYNGLILPKNALLYKDRKYFVFMQSGGEFIPKEVKARVILGRDFYEILEGLNEGDMVAKNALFILDSNAQNNGDYEW